MRGPGIVHDRPSGYSFLPELADCRCKQVSIETAQSKLDCSVLRSLPAKQILLGCIDLSDMAVETPETVAAQGSRVSSNDRSMTSPQNSDNFHEEEVCE